MITREVFKLFKSVFWRKSHSLHSLEQDLYGAQAQDFPFFFSSYSLHKATPEIFFSFHTLFFPFHPLPLLPTTAKRKKRWKVCKNDEKENFYHSFPFFPE